MFGRLATASALALVTGTLGLASPGSAAQAAPPHPHKPLAMHTAHVRLADDYPYAGPEPCSQYFDQRTAYAVPDAYGGQNPLAVCGYTPKQLRDAYGISGSGLTGEGVTVAVVDAYASPTIAADAELYSRRREEHPFQPGQFRQVTPPAYHHLTDGVCEDPASWAVEEALDVEAVHAMAPDAKIVYVAAASCADDDLYAALRTVVDQRLATVVSDSWDGVPHGVDGDEDPATMAAYSALFKRGNAQGMSFLFASGDCGAQDPSTDCAAGSARPQTDWPAQDPDVTAVGGTTLGIGAFHEYLGETAWGDFRSALTGGVPESRPPAGSWAPLPGTFRFGGGGGTSEDVPQPGYQRGVVPAALATTLLTGARAARPMRVLPDVSMAADPMTGFLVGVTGRMPDGTVGYGESSVGGTSLATPLFAGEVALAQQKAGHPLGFLNPGLYARAGSAVLHDVTATSLDLTSQMDVPTRRPGQPLLAVVDLGADSAGRQQARLYRLGDDGLVRAAPGYDAVTGVGSPTGAFVRSGG